MSDERDRFEIAGCRLVCPHCKGELFDRSPFAIATDRPLVALSLLTTVFRCVTCGRLQWFAREQEVHVAPEAITCLSCGSWIPEGASACPACGWTWVGEVEAGDVDAEGARTEDEEEADEATDDEPVEAPRPWRCRRCGRLTDAEGTVCQACGGRLEEA